MKNTMLFLFALVAVAAGCVQQGGQPANQNNQAVVSPPADGNGNVTGATQQNMVEISGFAFNPATITVAKGATVTWTNRDPVSHTITGPSFDSGSLTTGQTFSHTFNETGTYDYSCSIHPSMHGTVKVE